MMDDEAHDRMTNRVGRQLDRALVVVEAARALVNAKHGDDADSCFADLATKIRLYDQTRRR